MNDERGNTDNPVEHETIELAEIYGDDHTYVGLEAWSGTVVLRTSLYDAEVAVDLTPDEARDLAVKLRSYADTAEEAGLEAIPDGD